MTEDEQGVWLRHKRKALIVLSLGLLFGGVGDSAYAAMTR